MGGKGGRNSLCPRASLNISRGPAALRHGQVTAGPDPPRAAWGARSALPALTRGAGRPSPSSRPSRPVPSRRVPLGAAGGFRCESAAAGTLSDSWSLYRLPFPPRRGAGRYPAPGCRM